MYIPFSTTLDDIHVGIPREAEQWVSMLVYSALEGPLDKLKLRSPS